MSTIDLRSDTVTRPSLEMRRVMCEAEVGDDVFGEDPTVNKLQERVAELFGKEAALFVPSGTMGNQLSIKVHTQPGDEVLLEQEAHIFVYETAGAAFNSGVQLNPLPGVRGLITADQIKKAIRPTSYYLPITRLVCLENTHGRSAGSILPLEEIRKIRDLTLQEGIKLHLDGARIWNASIASGIALKSYAQYFDTLSVCFSKGLGAPIGSAVLGSRDLIEKARKYRKILGGGMRQVGIIAAGALYALEHNIERLNEDHEKAKVLADALSCLKTVKIDQAEVQTNMVIADIAGTGKSQSEVLNLLQSHGILLTPERHSSIRAVTHLDVTMDQVKHAASIFQKVFK